MRVAGIEARSSGRTASAFELFLGNFLSWESPETLLTHTSRGLFNAFQRDVVGWVVLFCFFPVRLKWVTDQGSGLFLTSKTSPCGRPHYPETPPGGARSCGMHLLFRSFCLVHLRTVPLWLHVAETVQPIHVATTGDL